MRKQLLALICLILATCCVGFGQQTVTTATVVDSDGTAWASGTYSIQYVNAIPGKPYNFGTGQFVTTLYTGVLNGSGAFTVTLDDVGYINPADGTWQFTICPDTSSGSGTCGSTSVAITGASQDVSSQINAAIRAPRPGGGPGAYGYADIEFQAVPGNTYIVSPAKTSQRCYTTAWAACNGGAGATLPYPGIVYGTSATAGSVATSAQIASALSATPSPVSVSTLTATSSTSAPQVNAGQINSTYHPAACGASNPPSWCAGSDMGAWFNAAYAVALTPAVTIVLDPGLYNYATPIVATTTGKYLTIVGNGAVLNYTPSTGTAMELGTNNSSYGEIAVTASKFTLYTSASGSTAVGLQLGTAENGPAILDSMDVYGFQFPIEDYTYGAELNHVVIHNCSSAAGSIGFQTMSGADDTRLHGGVIQDCATLVSNGNVNPLWLDSSIVLANATTTAIANNSEGIVFCTTCHLFNQAGGSPTVWYTNTSSTSGQAFFDQTKFEDDVTTGSSIPFSINTGEIGIHNSVLSANGETYPELINFTNAGSATVTNMYYSYPGTLNFFAGNGAHYQYGNSTASAAFIDGVMPPITAPTLTATTSVTTPNLNVTSDGVHAGYNSLVGNTANQAVVANTAGFMGPNSASFTGYALQLPSANPTANQVMAVGAPVSGVAPVTYLANSTTYNGQILTLGQSNRGYGFLLYSSAPITGNTGNIAATNLFMPTLTGNYMVCGEISVTVAGTTQTTPFLNITFNGGVDNVGKYATLPGIGGNTYAATSVDQGGCATFYMHANVEAQFNTTGYASTGTAMTYAVMLSVYSENVNGY